MNDAIREQLSAFVDGELPENEAELLLRRMSQDADLRQDVAKYLAIGRLMRSEPGLAGADRLHERITAAIDEKPADAGDNSGAMQASRAIRPLAGFAVAATVALVAIFALQQTTGVDEPASETPVPLASDITPGPVVPSIDAQEERQRQYFRNHAESSSQLGANGMISRVVTLRFSEEVVEDPEVDETDELEKATEAPTQP
jgi:sigma-E factor negative regulatory protein RseA